MNKVFLSYKNTVEGLPTKDSEMALELYEALTDLGIGTFYASQSLMELGVDKYKERIDEELDQCIVLVVVGTSIGNINSRWVKYEWDGFYLDILNGKNAKVFTYVDDINPHSLPRALRGVQSFDCGKDSITSIVSFIKNAIAEIEGELKVDEKNRAAGASVWNGGIQTASEYSSAFFCSRVRELEDLDLSEIEKRAGELAKIYSDIHTFRHFDKIEESDDIIGSMYKAIVTGIRKNNGQLMKVKGPLGSYKNLILQYVCLLISRKETDISPFYFDVSAFEQMIGNVSEDDSSAIDTMIRNHFNTIALIIEKDPEKKPLIIIDGIRDFSTGNEKLYNLLRKNIRRLKCDIVVGLDSDFTNNDRHKYSVHPIAGTDFEYYVRITPISLYKKQESISFINNCLQTFNVRIPYDDFDAEKIYDRLLKLNVTGIDAYWLIVLIREISGNILNERITLPDLYESICKKTLDIDELDSSAQLAYEFEYGELTTSGWDPYADKRWKTICKHRSVLDYLIARYYFLRLDELNVYDDTDIEEQLHFFSMILPKSVTIFVSPMINKIDAYENKVLTIAHNHYDRMSVLEKNQLIFWMGRLKNSVSVEESVGLLKKYREQQKQQYSVARSTGDNTKKNAFLLRTISVSLMVLGDKNAATDYFEMLIRDKFTNEVNRAFHLTYYGDKRYIPNKSMLDFEDDLQSGNNTFEVLCASIKKRINSNSFNYMLMLELFTLCSLLQARAEKRGRGGEVFFSKEYAQKAQRFIKWIIKQRKLAEFYDLKLYFEWMNGELEKYYINEEPYSSVAVFSELYSANSIDRAGWVERGVSFPESIVEHMYNCWLIGATYLPEKTENDDYDKNRILNMLLIHDLCEVSTGDIPRPVKEKRQSYYDETENRIMQEFIFSGTYPGTQNMSLLSKAWDDWYDNNDINQDIAKDIDTIQAVYQFCIYYLQDTENNYSEEDISEWLDAVYELKTQEGRDIATQIIIDNDHFSSIVAIWNDINSFD